MSPLPCLSPRPPPQARSGPCGQDGREPGVTACAVAGGGGGQTGAALSAPSACLLEQLTTTPSPTSWLGGVWPLLLALRAPHDPLSPLLSSLFSYPFAHPTPSSSLPLTPPSTLSNTLSSALPPTPPTTRSTHQLFLSRWPTHLHGCISSLFFSPISP